MNSEIENILKGTVVKSNDYEANKKLIGVSTKTIIPNEQGIVVLGKQNAFENPTLKNPQLETNLNANNEILPNIPSEPVLVNPMLENENINSKSNESINMPKLDTNNVLESETKKELDIQMPVISQNEIANHENKKYDDLNVVIDDSKVAEYKKVLELSNEVIDEWITLCSDILNKTEKIKKNLEDLKIKDYINQKNINEVQNNIINDKVVEGIRTEMPTPKHTFINPNFFEPTQNNQISMHNSNAMQAEKYSDNLMNDALSQINNMILPGNGMRR